MRAQYTCLAFLVLVPLVWSMSLNHDGDRGPLAAVSELNSAVSELNSRVASRAALLQGGTDRDARLPLPSAQDLETLRKVAQVLVMLGEQVLPSIFGERPSRPAPAACDPQSPQDIPNDAVKE